MKSILGIFSLALIAGGIWYFTSWNKEVPSTHLNTPSKPLSVTSAQEVPHQHAIPLTTPHTQQSIQTHTTPQKKSVPHKNVMMRLTDSESIAQTIAPRRFVKPAAAFELNQDALLAMQVGDTFDIADLEGKDYHITIKDLTKQGTDHILQGSYIDEGITYRILITTGMSGSTFIHLDTPEKNYEIELENGKGYAYDSMEIRRALSDESKDDFIIVEPKKNHTEQNPIIE